MKTSSIHRMCYCSQFSWSWTMYLCYVHICLCLFVLFRCLCVALAHLFLHFHTFFQVYTQLFESGAVLFRDYYIHKRFFNNSNWYLSISLDVFCAEWKNCQNISGEELASWKSKQTNKFCEAAKEATEKDRVIKSQKWSISKRPSSPLHLSFSTNVRLIAM